jgi:hypothetical protein
MAKEKEPKHYKVRVDAKTRYTLKILAAGCNKTMGDFIRELVLAYEKANKSAK